MTNNIVHRSVASVFELRTNTIAPCERSDLASCAQNHACDVKPGGGHRRPLPGVRVCGRSTISSCPFCCRTSGCGAVGDDALRNALVCGFRQTHIFVFGRVYLQLGVERLVRKLMCGSLDRHHRGSALIIIGIRRFPKRIGLPSPTMRGSSRSSPSWLAFAGKFI